jgi:hypothetical protein
MVYLSFLSARLGETQSKSVHPVAVWDMPAEVTSRSAKGKLYWRAFSKTVCGRSTKFASENWLFEQH